MIKDFWPDHQRNAVITDADVHTLIHQWADFYSARQLSFIIGFLPVSQPVVHCPHNLVSDGNRLHGDESLAIKRGDIEPSIMLDGCILSNTVKPEHVSGFTVWGTAGDRSNGMLVYFM